MAFPFAFHVGTNVATLAGAQHVFHCHYYNCALQDAIEKALDSEASQVLTDTAEATVRSQLERLLAGARGVDALQRGRDLFRQLGFGSFDLSAVAANGGEVRSDSSHYGLGWLSMYGTRPRPACYFMAGYLKALFAIAFSEDPTAVVVQETECVAAQGSTCRFKLEVKHGR